MAEWIWLLLGVALGGAATATSLLVLRSRDRAALAEARSRTDLVAADRDRAINELDQARDELRELDRARESAHTRVAVLEQELEAARQSFRERFETEKALREDMESRLQDTFKALGADALRSNNEQFVELAKKTFESVLIEAKGDVEKKKQQIDTLVKPIHDLLEKHNHAVGELEKKREVAYTRLEKQIEYIARSHEKLGSETSRLVTALRRPEHRGRWGEMQLRNAVEMAGMTEHCDFDEQVTIWRSNDRAVRPDMVVNLPGGGVIVVDAKVALDAYLEATEPDADRAACLKRHCNQIEAHTRSLANKAYWDSFERAPKIVVMFMPLESALMAALEVKPDLHAEAMKNHVLIATPTLLIALLRAVAYGWQQEDVAANAREISKTGRELYERIGRFIEHFSKVGDRLRQATQTYNSAVGSFDRFVIPGTRKLRDLHVTTDDEPSLPSLVDTDVRSIESANESELFIER